MLDWLMHSENLSLRKAVERLRAELGENPALVPLVAAAEPDVFADDEAGRQALLERVTAFYHQTLLNAPEAIAYLEKRRLHHPELVAAFKPGFANRTLAYRLPPKKLKDGAAIRARLQALGIMRESGHEHFTGCLVVPVAESARPDPRGLRAQNRQGRSAACPPISICRGSTAGVWNEQALIGSKSVILCESLIDAMSFWVAGWRNVTAAYGVNGFTDDHRRAFAQHEIKQVLIAFDNDAAVRLAAELVRCRSTRSVSCSPPEWMLTVICAGWAEPEREVRAAG
ncbi:toprim domain-containing protein [Erwinia pyrifoliae]|uniref:toprim domain-containing protein n=1 Tax=Erwinia pyrifoliae TaxID=79967 RepID=UPI00384E4447